jgi:hypothetical protein
LLNMRQLAWAILGHKNDNRTIKSALKQKCIAFALLTRCFIITGWLHKY